MLEVRLPVEKHTFFYNPPPPTHTHTHTPLSSLLPPTFPPSPPPPQPLPYFPRISNYLSHEREGKRNMAVIESICMKRPLHKALPRIAQKTPQQTSSIHCLDELRRLKMNCLIQYAKVERVVRVSLHPIKEVVAQYAGYR